MAFLPLPSFPGAEEKVPGTHCLHMRLIATEFRGDRVRTCIYIRILVMSYNCGVLCQSVFCLIEIHIALF